MCLYYITCIDYCAKANMLNFNYNDIILLCILIMYVNIVYLKQNLVSTIKILLTMLRLEINVIFIIFK